MNIPYAVYFFLNLREGAALQREHPALQNLSFTFSLILAFLDPDPLNVSNKTRGLRMIYL
jgi:hypothetical protein